MCEKYICPNCGSDIIDSEFKTVVDFKCGSKGFLLNDDKPVLIKSEKCKFLKLENENKKLKEKIIHLENKVERMKNCFNCGNYTVEESRCIDSLTCINRCNWKIKE